MTDPNALVPIAPINSESVDPALAEQMQTASGTTPGFTAATKINSLDDLRKKAPKVWKAMIQGVAWSICQSMHDAETRRHQIYLDGQQLG